MELEVGSGGQLFPSKWPHNLAIRFQSSMTKMVAVQPFLDCKDHCGACKKKWDQAATDPRHCGEIQRTSHTVYSCSLTKLNGGLFQLCSADDDATWDVATTSPMRSSVFIGSVCRGKLHSRWRRWRIVHCMALHHLTWRRHSHASPTCRTEAGSGPSPLNSLTFRTVVCQLSEVVPFLLLEQRCGMACQVMLRRPRHCRCSRTSWRHTCSAAATKTRLVLHFPFLVIISPLRNSGPCNSFYCLGHFKNVYDDDDNDAAACLTSYGSLTQRQGEECNLI